MRCMKRATDHCLQAMAKGWLLIAACACGSTAEPHPPAVLLVEPPTGAPCSDLTRAVSKWEGREITACGAGALRYRDLITLGDGSFVTWTPGTGYDELWRL